MKKLISLHLSTIIITATTFALTCYCLLNSHILSISAIIMHTSTLKTHLLILTLLPIYIAAMIFGAFTMGIYLGPVIQQSFFRRPKK